MSGLGYVLGLDVLIVGVEDHPTETYDNGSPVQKVYIDARYRGIYCVPCEEDAMEIRRQWDGNTMTHLTMPRLPAEFTYVDAPVRDPKATDEQ